jgi:chemotaxis protein MotB
MARKRHAAGGHSGGGERWLLTYADLITLLVAFFIVMFAGSRADLAKFSALSVSLKQAFSPGVFVESGSAGVLSAGGAGGDMVVAYAELPPQQQDFLKISERLDTFAAQNEMGQQIDVSTSMEGIIISMSGVLLFDSGSSILRPESNKALQTIADLVRPLSNQIRVEGHTDAIPPADPSFASNWELSTARALSVLRFLTDKGAIPAARMAVAGYGEFRPIADNDTRQGRALNRRVDIAIIYTAVGDGAVPFATPGVADLVP